MPSGCWLNARPRPQPAHLIDRSIESPNPSNIHTHTHKQQEASRPSNFSPARQPNPQKQPPTHPPMPRPLPPFLLLLATLLFCCASISVSAFLLSPTPTPARAAAAAAQRDANTNIKHAAVVSVGGSGVGRWGSRRPSLLRMAAAEVCAVYVMGWDGMEWDGRGFRFGVLVLCVLVDLLWSIGCVTGCWAHPTRPISSCVFRCPSDD